MIGTGLNRVSSVILEYALRDWLEEAPAAIAGDWRKQAGALAVEQLADQLREDFWALHGTGCNDLVGLTLARASLARVDWIEVARRLLCWAEGLHCP